MTNLTIPINDILFEHLRQLALQHGRDIETEVQVLLTQFVEGQALFQPQPKQGLGTLMADLFKDIPPAEFPEEEFQLPVKEYPAAIRFE